MIRPLFHTVLFLMTNRCNLVCKHCYVSSHPHGARGLSVDRSVRFSQELHDELGSLTFNLTGGEPLTRAADAIAILESASKYHKVKLLTNGTLVNERIARFLTDLEIVVRISLDGGSAAVHDRLRGRGSFDKLQRGLSFLEEAGYPMDRLEAYATITPGATNEVPKILDFAASKSIRVVKFESLAKGGRASTYWPDTSHGGFDPDILPYEEYFAREFERSCGTKWKLKDLTPWDMDFGTLNVYSNGDILPFTYQDQSDYKAGLLGNIYDSTLRDLIAPDRLEDSVLAKFLMIARGPRRSLHAFAATRLLDGRPSGWEVA